MEIGESRRGEFGKMGFEIRLPIWLKTTAFRDGLILPSLIERGGGWREREIDRERERERERGGEREKEREREREDE